MRFKDIIVDGKVLNGPRLIEIERKDDARGFFGRAYCQREFELEGIPTHWVQSNYSHSAQKGCLRGMHFQVGQEREKKIVRCIAGSAYDVIVDIRADSPTFLMHCSIILCSNALNAVYIPSGFAHGFQSLEANTRLFYQHSNFYEPNLESGFVYSDPFVGIEWPLPISAISQRDEALPLFSELEQVNWKA